MMLRRGGFTLIELIIVIVIIGILASIAAPMMGGMKTKAICAEAVTGMSAIKNAVRAYYAQYRCYPFDTGGYGIVYDLSYIYGLSPDNFREMFPGINKPDDLNGTYFYSATSGLICSCYSYVNSPYTNMLIRCYVNHSGSQMNRAPKYSDTVTIVDDPSDLINAFLQMDQNGKITQNNISHSGFPGT